MRIVLDTNVLVSGFLSPHGPPGAILRSVLAGSIAVCFDERILAEYRDVLSRGSLAFDVDRVDEVLALIEAHGEFVLAEPLGVELPDTEDAMFVEVAATAGAEVLVTGNRKHFPDEALRDLRVSLPGPFVAEYLRNPNEEDV